VVGLDHGFNHVGDQITAGQDVVIAFVALGNAVAGGNHTELNRSAAALENTLLDVFGNLVQVVMPRNDPVPGIGNAEVVFIGKIILT
jgi:hypothetical protein